MENSSSALLTVRFTPHLNRRDLLGSTRREMASPLPTCERPLPYLEEIPDWAPRREGAAASQCSTAPSESVDHYESWQGICW